VVTSKTSYKKIKTISPDIGYERRADGTVFLYSNIELEPHPFRLTEKLKFWAETTPDNIFIGQRDNAGIWRNLTYKETFNAVKCIAEALLKKDVSPTRPIAILSENSIEHALLALAALHIGIPYSPVSPAYSLKSTDFVKLKHVISLLTLGLIGSLFSSFLVSSSHIGFCAIDGQNIRHSATVASTFLKRTAVNISIMIISLYY
jgi:feruloyl-CoA synthase